MIKPSISIKGKLTAPIELKGKTNASIIKPKLESLEVIPGVEDQNLTSELDGFSNVFVKGDENLKPENIKKGTTIFGIEGKSANTSDATATSSNLDSGVIAYTKNDARIVGSAKVLNENVIYSLPSQLTDVGVATVVRIGEYIPLIWDAYDNLKVDMGNTTLFPASRLPVDVVGKNILLRVNLRTASHGYANADYVMHADLCIATSLDDVFEFRRDSSRDLIRCWDKTKKNRVNFKYYHFYKRLGGPTSTNYGTMEDITADKWEDKGKVSFGGDYYCYTNWHKFASNTMHNSGGLAMATPAFGRGDDCFLKTVFKKDYDKYNANYKLKSGGTLITRIPNEGVASAIGLVPESIRKGYRFLGVEGSYEGIDTSDATVTASDVLQGKTVYINNEKVEGTLPNNGELEYQPSEEEQSIPEGYTAGGVIKPVDITTLDEYNSCLTLANSIDNLEDYSDTTATAEDILEGKVAYANGERIVGIMPVNTNNTTIDISGQTVLNASQVYKSITQITSLDVKSLTSMANTFKGYDKLKTIKLININEVRSFQETFSTCPMLEEVILEGNPIYLTSMYRMFYACVALKKAPFFNITKQATLYGMFQGCRELVEVPVYDTSNANNMEYMFNECYKLSDESLNNILSMCINANRSNITTRTLKYIGLSQEQAIRCQSLSNYQAFIDADWATGY